MIQNNNLKIKENKIGWGLDSPRYMITYNVKSSEEENCKNSFEIISALKGSNDVLIEFNSSLLMINGPKSESCTSNFIKAVKTMNLNYRYRKSAPLNKRSFFAQLLNGSSKDAHEVLVYIPDEVWKQEGFYSILPTGGLRYYISNGPVEGNKILEDIFNGFMIGDEKLDFFNLVIFDCCSMGQMGVVSSHTSFDEVKQALGI